MKKAQEIIKDSKIVQSKKENDTIRLWESYKEQALLWRSIALLQLPTTFVAVIFALIMWHTRTITLSVPRQPLPGTYSVEEINDEIFADYATTFTNLIATYTPANARRQFGEATLSMSGELLSKFKAEVLEDELRQIESTSRTQLFIPDPTRTEVRRDKGSGVVTIKLFGERTKYIADRQVERSTLTAFKISLRTVPRNNLNPYGIQVRGISNETPQGR